MTPNEQIVLKEIERLGSANAVLVSRRMNLNPVDYADYLCKRLHAKGYLERIPSGRWIDYCQKSLQGLSKSSQKTSS